MKKLILAKFLFLGMCNYAFGCTVNPAEAPIFTSNTFLGNFNSNIPNFTNTINISVTPKKYGTVFENCLGNNNGTSKFQISTSNIDTSQSINYNYTRYYRIKNTSISPSVANHPNIYISFRIRDNQDSSPLYTVGINEIEFYRGISDTRGIRLEQVRIYIEGSNLTPGSYYINQLILGTFTAKGSGNDPSASQTVILKNLHFTIGTPTCTINDQIVTLPAVPSSAFSNTVAKVGATKFTITATCSNSSTGSLFKASITDNNSASTSNNTGILVNGITARNGGSNAQIILTDAFDQPIAISSTSNLNKFEFGTLELNNKVSKAFKAAYIPTVLPVTAGKVQSKAMINLTYD